jgi:hypothetical protein
MKRKITERASAPQETNALQIRLNSAVIRGPKRQREEGEQFNFPSL